MNTTGPIRKPFLSIQTFAAQLGLSPETVRRAIHRGEIPSVRVGHVFRIPMEALETWKKEGRPR